MWQQHRHHTDAAYNSVILHVVWQHDTAAYREDGTELPVVALADRVQLSLVHQYQSFQESQLSIPCGPHWPPPNPLTVAGMIETAVIKRLQRKAAEVTALLAKTGNNWEEAAYRLTCRNFGLKINAEPAEQLATLLPFKVLQHHTDQLIQLEALLFGQAGLLPETPTDEYSQKLKKEYSFLKHKYQLSSPLPGHQWKFFRLRPANFPTVRLAQLAAFFYQNPRFFSTLLQAGSLKELAPLFKFSVSAYWQEHYLFGKKRSKPIGKAGTSWKNTLLLNTLPPLLFAYSQHKQELAYQEKAIKWLEELPAEKNHLIAEWNQLGQTAFNGFDSQGLIEMHQQFCMAKKCLSCGIGLSILSKKQ